MLSTDLHRLRSEDCSWDYRNEPTKRYSQGFHSYPAMMIPQVASRLIRLYSNEGDILLDPFCGSGSVLVEAKVAKRYSWGIDLNPLAILIAKAKTTPINPSLLYKEYYRLIDRIRQMPDGEVATPQFFNIDFWFKKPVIEGLAKIKAAIDEIGVPEIQDFFKVAFSEVVRLSSNSRSGEFKLFRYPESKLENYSPRPLDLFIEKAGANIEAMRKFHELCHKGAWSRELQADSTEEVEEIRPGTIDIIVTSPPYGDSRTTVAYGQFSRLSSQWLGLMPEKAIDIDREMLGGRPVRQAEGNLPSPTLTNTIALVKEKDETRSKQVKAFYVDFCKSLKHMATYLRTGGFACIVIGNRRVKGMELPTDIITCELAQEYGLEPLQIIVRNIPNKTMPLRNSPTNVPGATEATMVKEYIVILKKERAS